VGIHLLVLYCTVLARLGWVGGIAGRGEEEKKKKGWEHGQLGIGLDCWLLVSSGRLSFGCGCGRDGWMVWGLKFNFTVKWVIDWTESVSKYDALSLERALSPALGRVESYWMDVSIYPVSRVCTHATLR